MALELSTEQVNQLLEAVNQVSLDRPQAELEADHPGWRDDIAFLYDRKTPLTYLPVLCVTLVARSLSADVNVKRIQRGDDYNASLVGQALTRWGALHEVDVRTDSTNVMNNQPFIRRPEITPDLNPEPAYARFYTMVERVVDLTPADAREVLALVLRLGRENWPQKYRRGQKSQTSVESASAPPADTLLAEAEDAPLIAPTTSDTSDTLASFILNRSSSEDVVHRDGADYYGFHENVTSAQALVRAGGGQFVYYNTSNNNEHPMHFVGCGRLTSVEEVAADEEGRRNWVARVAEYVAFDRPVPKAEAAPPRWNAQHSIAKISADSYGRIVELGTNRRVTPQPLTVHAVWDACIERGLLLPRRTVTALVAALNSDKHVILTGPPGTAKTTLAELVAKVAKTQNLCDGHLLTTATADWSTYDTIGGLAPTSDNRLVYRPGRFVEALQSNLWLVVDEMNRSNFDRAFGPLFTVLAGTDVTLPYDDAVSGLPVRIVSADTPKEPRYRDVVVAREWRMIGTINNFDKSLLFELSFALMRRFAFVEVPAPDDSSYRALIASHTEDPNLEVATMATAAVEALLPLRRLKELGPAIFIDAAKLARQLALAGNTRAEAVFAVFYALMLPQFEGLDERRGAQLLRLVTTAVDDRDLRGDVLRVLREVLGLELAHAGRTSREDEPIESDLQVPNDLEVASEIDDEASNTASA